MALKVEATQLWSCKIEDRPGGAAGALKPLADAKVCIEFLLARRTPEDPGKGILFVAPITGCPEAEQAARAAGLAPSADISALRVEGDDRAGAGHQLTGALAAAGVSFRGMAANVLVKKYVCYVALDTAGEAQKAAEAIKALAACTCACKPKAKPARKGKKRR